MAISKKNKTTEIETNLSILIARDGLSFCISNGKSENSGYSEEIAFKKNLTPEEILQQIEIIFQDKKIGQDPIKNISVIYATNLNCFVPEELFDEKHLSDYLKFNVKILTTDFLAFDNLECGKLVNVFVPYANINNYFFERFGAFEYRHSASVFIENILKSPQPEEIMHVQVFWQHFDLVVTKAESLIICNTFHFETPEDFVYYILFVAEQLKLDPEKFRLKLSGNISETSEFYILLSDYVRNCSLPNKSDLGRTFQQDNTFSNLLCE